MTVKLRKIYQQKKKYQLEIQREKYKLSITIDNRYINFKLYPVNNNLFIYYKNQFDLRNINDLLYLNNKIYSNTEKILKLIDDCHSNNKLSLKDDIGTINISL